jgi:methionyl aminopeptidase
MAIILKNAQEIAKMRTAGQLAAEVLRMIEPHVQPGVSTIELDAICHRYIVEVQRASPSPLNYRGFPKSICTSVNHQVCHGIPNHKRLKKGDIVNVDITVLKDGFHGDTSKMFFVGEPGIQAKRLVQTAYDCMRAGIEQVRPGAYLSDIGKAIEKYAEARRYSVVQEYCGHGIGRDFHEEPQVLHYHDGKPGPRLEPGMTFTIEPMINAGKRHVKVLPDGWTVVTKDHSLSAQWEHTVAVTESGVDVLTKQPGENFPG